MSEKKEEVVRIHCSQFEEALDDLDRAGTPETAMREAAIAHAETCSHCAQLMTDNEALDFSLRTLARQDAPLQAPARVEAALLEEFRRRRAAKSGWRSPWQVAAIAALVLLALGLVVRRLPFGKRSAAGGGGAPMSTNLAAQAPSVEASENAPSETQEETAFVSLPYATDPETLEGGTVVRVELSRVTLASMGMPVADAGSTDRIPADIVLSEDGAPQAIRLVSSASTE